MIAHGKDIKIFSGNSNPKLALDICKVGYPDGQRRGGRVLRRREVRLHL